MDWRDAALLLGLLLVSVGSALVARPAGLIVPGVILLYLALFHSARARSAARRPER